MFNELKRHAGRVAAGLALVVIIAGHAMSFYRIPALDRLDRWLYDVRLSLSAKSGLDSRVVIVDIDERSLAALGRWPWRRELVAKLLDELFDRYKARVVGFDILFGEPDASSGLAVLDRLVAGPLKESSELKVALEGLRDELDYDARLARAMRDRAVVLGIYFSNETDGRSAGAAPPPVLAGSAFSGRRVDIHGWTALGGNLPALQKAAAGAGHFNAIPDADGLTRRVPMLAAHNGQYFESLSLAVMRRAQGAAGSAASVVAPEFGGGRFGQGAAELERLRVGGLNIPVDERAAALVPYRGARGSFPYLSAADVIAGRAHPEILRDRIVLVGATAPGLFDLRATPMGSVFPGVEIHANLIAGMLDGTVRAQPLWLGGVETMIVLLLGTVLALSLPVLGPFAATGATLVALLAVGLTGVLLWSGANLVMPLASAFCAIGAVFGFNMILGYFVESRAKRQFQTLFGEYVPPALVDRMARDPGRYSTEPRNEVLTVIFTDLRGFTALAEALPPSDLRVFLNAYLTECSEIVHRHQGTVDKYIGDAIMAFWGAPVADPDHARNAVVAAMALMKAARELSVKLPDGSSVQMGVGIGINTGLMNVGDMGSQLRRSYTVLGDAVNLASRLESLTKYYGVGILIGERTKAMIPDLVCRELDRVRVKGKGEAVAVYEPLGLGKELAQQMGDELKLWGQMLRAYRAADWDQAELTLLNMQRLYPRGPLYELYLSRIVRLRAEPPPSDWDGVTVFDRK